MAKMLLLLFLLCSGFSHFTFASNRLRHFSYRNSVQGFNVSKTCKQHGENLITLYDDDDTIFTENFMYNHESSTEGSTLWLGLLYGRDITWSDGNAFNAAESPVNVTWDSLICEAIVNNSRTGFSCSKKIYFMCYKGNNYTLIEKQKDWCQALLYCKKHYTNLASITNEMQKERMIIEGKNTSFWIGLMHDAWQWQDKSCSSFRKWSDQQQRKDGENLTVQTSKEMSPQNNDIYYPLICSKGIVRIQVVNQSKNWEEALNHCRKEHSGLLMIYDEEDQKAVEQWLTHRSVSAGPYWIGLRQSRVFGFWIWSDRTVNVSNWRNDTSPELPMSNPCGVINSPGHEWSDEDCSVELPFICEEEIVFMN